MPSHIKAMHLIAAQVDYNVSPSIHIKFMKNDTVLDKRLWILVLIKKLIQKNRSTNLSYDNLVGNFKDGEIGRKIKS
jgi:hypothetical protein